MGGCESDKRSLLPPHDPQVAVVAMLVASAFGGKRSATDQDLSPLVPIRSTERCVTPAGLVRVRRLSPYLTSPCGGAHYGYFAAQAVWRYAPGLAGSVAICRSAYY